MSTHPLDRPIWNALSTRQSTFSVGGDGARRFTPDIGPLAGPRDESEEALRALASLVAEDEGLVVFHFQAGALTVPPPAAVEHVMDGVQMVLGTLQPAPGVARIERLADADAPEMLALATLTKPGPFRTRTHRLGTFWGIREEGRLLAMAGERLAPPGYTEVSGVCTHPDARGRGYAALLSHWVSTRILERGERPFLHAFADNEPALRVYRSLGFTLRARMQIVMLKKNGE